MPQTRPHSPRADQTPVRVLVVEDEDVLARALADYLRREGYDVEITHDGPSAVQAARSLEPHLILLDLGLPGLDGVEVCTQLRTFSDAYVIMLTARADEEDVLRGLDAGADDYVTKPFRPRELVARAQVVLRRARTPGPLPVALEQVGGLVVEHASRTVTLEGESVDLTPTELDILVHLVRHRDRVVTRRELIEALRGPNWYGDDNLVDVHILHLRRKLRDDASTGRFVRTVRGAGYQLGSG